jgi:hypothetical protein
LWTPFTLIVGFVLDTTTNCTGSTALICTRPGHAGIWLGSAGAVLGLAIVVVGSWIHPRRDHGLWALIGLASAAAGFLLTLGLATGAPPE